MSPKINFLWETMLASLQFLLQYVLYSWHNLKDTHSQTTQYELFVNFWDLLEQSYFILTEGRIFMLDKNVIQCDGTKFIFEDKLRALFIALKHLMKSVLYFTYTIYTQNARRTLIIIIFVANMVSWVIQLCVSCHFYSILSISSYVW